MIDIHRIKGVLFDYGGTIDTNGMHWAEVIWKAYQSMRIPVSKEDFLQAYIYAERMLEKRALILPVFNYWDTLRVKTQLQVEWLLKSGSLLRGPHLDAIVSGVTYWCYTYAKISIETARPILCHLSVSYPLALVTNFYGNIETILKDFRLDGYFSIVIESEAVGIRKPHPDMFALGLEGLKLLPEDTVVIGDSYDKDIAPAALLGCQTIWLKRKGWGEYRGDETADEIISDITELMDLFATIV
ncbi:MAG: HAD family hydrolase [Tannerellaceae bacterium]|jgi:putative hydrolase of the HAD superfamily|nr:HAD family hydrolase [Tannerellaceae bacterium]